MSLFAPPTPSYAQEQLDVHLGSLATLPVAVSTDIAANDAGHEDIPEHQLPSGPLQSALQELTQSKPPSLSRLATILEDVSHDGLSVKTESQVDRAAEAEILTRSVTLIWAHVMQAFVDGALKLEDDRTWWSVAIDSRLGTVIYLVQSLPKRLYDATTATLKEGGKAGAAAFKPKSFKGVFSSIHWPSHSSLFRSLHGGAASTLALPLAGFAALASPLQLTRREMLANRHALTLARDGAALRVGILATQGPQWFQGARFSVSADDLVDEASRVYAVLCDVLSVNPEEPETETKFDLMAIENAPQMAGVAKVVKKHDRSLPRASPKALLSVLQTYLPRAEGAMNTVSKEYGRPSPLVRLWFPFLFLPPALYVAASAIVRNKEWMKEQVENAKETIKGFFVQWVWDPIEEIISTMRGGGEGLGVSPETVKADQDSLERMVIDLGRDYYHMDGPQLDALKKQVESGDLSLVLKAYEKEMQSPIKNALLGNLVRTLLIQVQKTKTDLSLALERLDQLLRSQQLTFAFVGVAPSVLVLWGLGSWLSTVWRGENRGKDRRRRYFYGLRNVERILITAPEDDARLSNRDRGMIIVSVSGLRTWAVGMGSSRRRQSFLDDLRMVENPALSRVDKLHVVERMWRSWGLDGRKKVV